MTKELEKKFEDYHAENPHVYDMFKKFSYDVYNTGLAKYSANAIFERIRWFVDIETVGDKFKINNNYRPYYARKLMMEDEKFSNFFEIRELKE